ncbi:MAG: hypothetical protein IJQ34_09415 [Kiritimatiellae bacterium]|nr:hypothetical protein [Kiritimatiellia bacterium]
MDVQATILASRFAGVSAMRDENAKLKVENAKLKQELAVLNNHFDFALTAAADLHSLEEGGRFIIIDGWNILLGDDRARLRKENTEFGVFWQKKSSVKGLCEVIEKFLAEHPKDYIWLVLDGQDEKTIVKDRYRITYTGGVGPQRADKMIVSFVRMAHFRDDPNKIVVVTADKRLQIDVRSAQKSNCGVINAAIV